jgi:DNA-binding beta-propeller fold protein YncE
VPRLRARRVVVAAVAGAAALVAAAAVALVRDPAPPPAAPEPQIVLGRHGAPGNGSYSLVLVDGGFRVYDADRDFALVKSVSFPGASTLSGPRGLAVDAATARLYASFRRGPGREGHMLAYDLLGDRVIWTLDIGPDSFALTPDGAKIYAPCGEERGGCDHWFVLDAVTGRELGRITMHEGPHNTIVSLDGDRVFLASVKHDRLAVVDPRRDEIVSWVGPFRDSIRPFTVNRAGSLVFVTVDFLSGFEVASLETGRKLYTVEVSGFPVAPEQHPRLPVTQSHGIALTPDERELWVADDVYDHVHVFDVRGLPGTPPRQVADIPLGDSPKWINFTRDGRFAHISTGEIVDRHSRRVVALVAPSRQYVEVDWEAGRPVRAYSRYGLGYRA